MLGNLKVLVLTHPLVNPFLNEYNFDSPFVPENLIETVPLVPAPFVVAVVIFTS